MQNAERRVQNPAARAVWSWRWLDELGRDVRLAYRRLRRTPGFTATAIITLALGIGVNAAVFVVIYGILLRPLPYREPSRLVIVSQIAADGTDLGIVPREVGEWLQRLRTVEDAAAYHTRDLTRMRLAPAARASDLRRTIARSTARGTVSRRRSTRSSLVSR